MAFTTPGHAFSHTQSVASDSWTINHKLNNLAPMVSVVLTINGVNTVVIPANIAVIDANNITITFTQAVTGTARIA